jgi:AAA domain
MAGSIASGQHVWNCYTARRGRVIHIDYEQAFRLTRERYQRLAAGVMVTPDELAGHLSVVAMPQVYLDDPKHEAFLTAAVEGYDMAIVDSLRACGPSIEENGSSVRGLLDMLNRVSDNTGCCFIVIHHARKPARDGASAGGAKMAIRGSGAIFDACASVVILEAEKGKATKVTHEKARTSGITSDDFLLRVEDREVHGDPRGGLVVLAESMPMAGTAAGAFETLKKRALEALAKGPKASKTALAACFPGNIQQKYAAIDQLVMEGSVVTDGKRFLLPGTS